MPRTLFSRKFQDKIKEISGMACYNCKKKGHITRGYRQSTRKPETVERKVKKGLEKPLRKAAAV